MQLQNSLLVYGLLTGAASLVAAASSWGFDDATVSVQGKGAGVSGGSKEKCAVKTLGYISTPGLMWFLCICRLIANKALSKPIQLGASDTLKILLTAQEDKKPKRPHQAFLQLTEPTTGLETSYALAAKENGKAKVELVSFQGTYFFGIRLT